MTPSESITQFVHNLATKVGSNINMIEKYDDDYYFYRAMFRRMVRDYNKNLPHYTMDAEVDIDTGMPTLYINKKIDTIEITTSVDISE